MQLQSALELGYCWRTIGTCEVDRGPENEYGLRGMAGNVSEWTTRDPRVDGTFGEVLRRRNPSWRWKVAYGTSWKDPDLDVVDMLFLAAVVPYSDDHASVNPGIGFRCAL